MGRFHFFSVERVADNGEIFIGNFRVFPVRLGFYSVTARFLDSVSFSSSIAMRLGNSAFVK